MDALLNLIPGGSLTAIGGVIVAALLAFWRAWAAGKSAGRNQEKAKQNDAYEKHLDAVERASSARNDVLSGRVPERSDDPNRRD